MGGRRLPGLELDDAERAELKALTSRRKTGQAVALRARIVLACAQGGEKREVAALLVGEKTAAKLIGVSPTMLIAGRFRKRPLLPFVRVGSRAIRYRVADIEDIIYRNTNRA